MSTLSVSNVSDGTTTVGTSYVVNGSAKAWGLLNGDNTTITDSFNIGSMTDGGTGQPTVAFTNNMSNATYITVAGGSDEGAGPTVYVQHSNDTKTASSVVLRSIDRNGSSRDDSKVEFAIMGDLA